jgi:N-carbamoyl-L-amino-acid hydrolase
VPAQGQRVWDWAEELAAHSDPGFKEQGQLTVTYLTEAHQTCARRLMWWMKDCGFDEVLHRRRGQRGRHLPRQRPAPRRGC